MTTAPLVVPVRLDAMMIGSRDEAFLGFMPPYANFRQMASKANPKPNIANDLLSQPFQGGGPLEQGVHLHWTLPRALRVADYGKGTGAMKLHAAPDRWLVTRTRINARASTKPVCTVEAWVVESNWVSPSGQYSPTTIPYAAKSDQPFSFLGRVYRLADWSPTATGGAYLPQPLTAVGFGVPHFSMYYPNCRNVFGMADKSLNDSDFDHNKDALIYSVTGWYSDPANDPLAGADAAEVAAAFGWTYPKGEIVPSRTLCHGLVYRLPWDADGDFLHGQDTELAAGVAFGNTTAEALSAHVAKMAGAEESPHVEQILNALQLGVLATLNEPGGLARMEEALYGAGFSGLNGGDAWRIRAKDPKAPSPILNKELTQAIALLLSQQESANAAEQRIAGLKDRIFSDWYHYIIVAHSPNFDGPDFGAIMTYIQAEVRALNSQNSDLADLKKKIADNAVAIRSALEPIGLILESQPMPRFNGPREPAVILTDDGIPRDLPDDDDAIACVFLDVAAPAIDLPAGLVSGSKAVSLQADALPKLNPPAVAVEALAEPVLLAQRDLIIVPDAAGVVAQLIAAKGGADNPAVIDFTKTVSLISKSDSHWLDAGSGTDGISYSGSLLPQPAIAGCSWLLPWQPIALSWRCTWRPILPINSVNSNYAKDVIETNFAFDPAVSLNLFPNQDPSYTWSRQFSGATLLSGGASVMLQQQIKAYLAQHPEDKELEEILKALGDKPALSQALSGFNAGLVGQLQSFQLPISDPAAQTRVQQTFTNVTVHNAVGERNRIAPDFTSTNFDDPVYNALRAGLFKLDKLAFIDRFGRARDIQTENIAVSVTLRDTPPPSGEQSAFVLPLRYTQPTRLEATLLSAQDTSIPDCGASFTNPICGWLVPNLLHGGFAYYDADGAAIGSHIATPTGLVWEVAPDAGPPTQTFAESFSGRNPTLTAMATALNDGGTDYVIDMLRAVQKTRSFVTPSAYQTSRETAMLIGAPLALIQYDLRFAMAGLPVPDQSYTALDKDIKEYNTSKTADIYKRTIHALNDVQIPVVLGDQIDLDDGLFGYFIPDKSGRVTFSTFYAATADERAGSHVVKPSIKTVMLSLGASPVAQRVAMLVDPRAAVHVNTGLMPVQRLSLKGEVYSAALGQMAFNFLTAPVLAPAGEFSIPVPQEGDGAWRWVAFTDDEWRHTEIAPPALTSILQRSQCIQDGWLQLIQAREVE
jgi:hypothetical protein